MPRRAHSLHAGGDRLDYEVSFASRWRIDEVYDPLALAARLTIEIVEDARADGAGPITVARDASLVLRARLSVRQAAYSGPNGKWAYTPERGVFRGKGVEASLARARAGSYMQSVAAAEERLGLAAIALSGRPFGARIDGDGAVSIEPLAGETLTAGPGRADPDGGRLLRRPERP